MGDLSCFQRSLAHEIDLRIASARAGATGVPTNMAMRSRHEKLGEKLGNAKNVSLDTPSKRGTSNPDP